VVITVTAAPPIRWQTLHVLYRSWVGNRRRHTGKICSSEPKSTDQAQALCPESWTEGYRDAVEQTGSGFAPTFPSDAWYPPLLTIDHVLIRNAAARSVRAVDVAGADHRALLVTVRVPIKAGGQ